MMRSGKKGLLFAALLIIIATASVFYFYIDRQMEEALLQPQNLQLTSRGAGLYAENCASCHGGNLEGESDWRSTSMDGSLPAPPHDETGHTWHHTDDLLFRITKFGTAKAAGLDDLNSNMPAFEETLSDEDIIGVLSWIKSQWPEELQQRHDALNKRNRSLKK